MPTHEGRDDPDHLDGGAGPAAAAVLGRQGRDEFDEAHNGKRGKMLRFFTWFYILVSIGVLLAVTVLVYVQDNVGCRWGYGILVGSPCSWRTPGELLHKSLVIILSIFH